MYTIKLLRNTSDFTIKRTVTNVQFQRTGKNGPPGADGPQGPPGADSVVPGPQGPQGPIGDTGPQGPQGIQGVKGDTGEGVPIGGTAGQVLSKINATDYNTQWSNQTVTSVNAQTGIVVLDTDDIADTATNRYTSDTDITRLANTSGTNTGDQDISGIATNASDITAIELEQITQNDAIALNTAKRSYPSADETRLANTSGTNTGDQDLSGYEPLITGADANTVWHGNKSFSQVVEADMLLTDNTTNNVSTLRHGFMSKLPGGTTIFYRGDGTFAV